MEDDEICFIQYQVRKTLESMGLEPEAVYSRDVNDWHTVEVCLVNYSLLFDFNVTGDR